MGYWQTSKKFDAKKGTKAELIEKCDGGEVGVIITEPHERVKNQFTKHYMYCKDGMEIKNNNFIGEKCDVITCPTCTGNQCNLNACDNVEKIGEFKVFNLSPKGGKNPKKSETTLGCTDIINFRKLDRL